MNYSLEGSSGGQRIITNYTPEQYITNTIQRPDTPSRRVIHSSASGYLSGGQISYPLESQSHVASGRYHTSSGAVRQYVAANPSLDNSTTVKYYSQPNYNTTENQHSQYQSARSTENLNAISSRSQDPNRLNIGTSNQTISSNLLTADADYRNKQGNFQRVQNYQNVGSEVIQRMPQIKTTVSPEQPVAVNALPHMTTDIDTVFKQMTIANDHIRTLVHENDKLIGAAREFKKGLEQRTEEYQELKKEIDLLRSEFHASQIHNATSTIQKQNRNLENSQFSQTFTAEEREQLLEIIEQQRQEIEKLSSKKKKKKIHDDIDIDNQSPEVDFTETQFTSHDQHFEEYIQPVKPKKKKKTDAIDSDQKSTRHPVDTDFQSAPPIKPRKKVSTDRTTSKNQGK